MINDALLFMALGMGVVFVFLTIMVLAIKLQAYIINKLFGQKPKVNKKIVGVIVGALMQHSQKKA